MAVCTPPQRVCFPVSSQGEGGPAGGHSIMSVRSSFAKAVLPTLEKDPSISVGLWPEMCLKGQESWTPAGFIVSLCTRRPTNLPALWSTSICEIQSPYGSWTVETMLSSWYKLRGNTIDVSELSQDSLQVNSWTGLKSICARQIQALSAAVACCMESGHPRQAEGMKPRIIGMRSQGQHLAPKSSGSLLR